MMNYHDGHQEAFLDQVQPAPDNVWRPATRADRTAGAANLIDNCIGNVAGLTVLLVCENPKLGW